MLNEGWRRPCVCMFCDVHLHFTVHIVLLGGFLFVFSSDVKDCAFVGTDLEG